MHSVLVLISVLQLCIRFPAVAGDCYDDPLDNNRSYDNCGTCYQTLASALINTADNKYYLGKTFFPHNAVMPVQVTVTYKPVNVTKEKRDIKCQTDGGDTTWYWIQGEFFAYQPLDVFTYRSLFFSHPRGRQSSIDLYLPYQCLCDSGNFEEFFEYLTQRVS